MQNDMDEMTDSREGVETKGKLYCGQWPQPRQEQVQVGRGHGANYIRIHAFRRLFRASGVFGRDRELFNVQVLFITWWRHQAQQDEAVIRGAFRKVKSDQTGESTRHCILENY